MIRLPQGDWLLPAEGVPCLLVAGGSEPDKTWLAAAAEGRVVWSVDRGLSYCRSAGLVPHKLIGDGDSARPEDWQWALEQGVPAERYPSEKDDTDMQLALALLQQAYPAGGNVIVCGGWGSRPDHFFSTLFSLADWGRRAGFRVIMADDQQHLAILYETEKIAFHYKERMQPLVLSLLPLSTSATVSLQGVRWPLQEASLSQAYPYAVSNRVLAGERPIITVSVGMVGCYLAWHEG